MIEDSAIQQLYTTAKLTGAKTRYRGCHKDLHPGARLSYWRSLFLADAFVRRWSATISAAAWRYGKRGYFKVNITPDKLEKRAGVADRRGGRAVLEENVPPQCSIIRGASALGSIGGGNHFCRELQ